MGALVMESRHGLPAQLPILLCPRYRQPVLRAAVYADVPTEPAGCALPSARAATGRARARLSQHLHLLDGGPLRQVGAERMDRGGARCGARVPTVERSEERRVGKEC